jgi:two-component system repressor protein LuxO
MPPLRERDEDVLMIARHFLEQFSTREGRAFEGFTPEAQRAICRYPWPGNVRQLQNAVHQVVVLNDARMVERSMLPEAVTSGHLDNGAGDAGTLRDVAQPGKAQHDPAAPHVARRERVEPLWLTEKNAVEAAIEACGGNVNHAAGLLEVAPSTIYRKLQTWKKIRA